MKMDIECHWKALEDKNNILTRKRELKEKLKCDIANLEKESNFYFFQIKTAIENNISKFDRNKFLILPAKKVDKRKEICKV